MTRYQYRPVRFYVTCFSATWAFWIAAAVTGRLGNDGGISTVFMLLGLLAPAVTAVITVLTSGSGALRQDLKRKLVGFYRVKPLSILLAVIGFAAIVVFSILLSREHKLTLF